MIYMLLLSDTFFGRKDYDWQSIEIDRAMGTVKDAGLAIQAVPIAEFNRTALKPNDLVWYSSQANPVVHAFVKDLLYFVEKRCTIVPRYDLLMAYENKGAQALVKQELGLDMLWEQYVYRPADLPNSVPFVLKTAGGAGSSGVHLVEARSGLKRIGRKVFHSSRLALLKQRIRRHRLAGSDRKHYADFKGPVGLCVAQEFVVGLKGDFKVLAFGLKYYVLTREVRQNDFRASGSGRFSFGPVDDDLLTFARSVFVALDTPYVSLDIAKGPRGYVLFEFQALNFGPLTLRKSPGWYEYRDGKWEYQEGRSDLSEETGRAFCAYVRDASLSQSPQDRALGNRC